MGEIGDGMDYDLDSAIRKVPGFPKPGILFYDVTGILAVPEAFRWCVDRMEALYAGRKLDAVAAVEARGFVFAAPLADRLRLPLVLLRKKGKLPGETLSATFALEYGMDTIQVHKSDVQAGARILLVDDLIATGGTLKAAADLLTRAGGVVEAVFGVIGLPFLHYDRALAGLEVTTLINYHGE
jgi:adenine phosphoribosyltransferase